jgi:GTPase SAR1 family protein
MDSKAENLENKWENAPVMLWQTKLRGAILPYLPPPVVQAIHRVDPKLEDFIGPEGSITILSSLFLGWFVMILVRFFSSRVFGSGRALADDDEDVILSSKTTAAVSPDKYDASVLLVGPPGGGKTRLFYRLCYGRQHSNVPTLMSLKANVGISQVDTDNNTTIRYMDWPGCASLTDEALKSVLVPSTRFVLVLDATQPVTPTADILNQLLMVTHQHFLKTKKRAKIFIACHKTDLPKAKNWRRIKIQMRTELERLLTVQAAASAAGSSTEYRYSATTNEPLWWPAGDALDLQELDGAELYFASTSSESRLPPELPAFCHTGVLPDDTGANTS